MSYAKSLSTKLSPAMRAILEARADYLCWTVRDLQTTQWSEGFSMERCDQITLLNRELTETLRKLQQD